jgi:hypothetical protein
MSRLRFGSKAASGMIAFGLVVVAASLAAGSNPALAYNPDAEKCHYEKQCKLGRELINTTVNGSLESAMEP